MSKKEKCRMRHSGCSHTASVKAASGVESTRDPVLKKHRRACAVVYAHVQNGRTDRGLTLVLSG